MRFSNLLCLLLAFVPMVVWADPPPSEPPHDAVKTPTAPESGETPVAPAPAAAPKLASVSLDDIRAFTAVYSLVKQGYVEDVSDTRLLQAAIRGMLSGLDPHSDYLDRKQMETLTEETSGNYSGLGIEVFAVDGALRVISPIDDTPATRAGIKAGDTIVRIDGKPVQSDDLDGSIDRLRGKPGSEIVLGIVHEGTSTIVDLTLKREVIRIASVRGRVIEPAYAYLRIAGFQGETGGDLRTETMRLLKESGGHFNGLVLDLRSNPGGLVSAAVDVSDTFLESGVIVTTRGRLREADLSFSANPGDLAEHAPMVVLVDNGTASAAEIVAGALKDNHRAVIMGRRTFGKGSVQTILPIDADHAVKLTTARYFTPSGVSIQAQGIVPDIALSDYQLTRRDDSSVLRYSERDLRNHLKGTDEDAAAREPASVAGPAQNQQDYALNEALNVLKGLALQRLQSAPAAARKG